DGEPLTCVVQRCNACLHHTRGTERCEGELDHHTGYLANASGRCGQECRGRLRHDEAGDDACDLRDVIADRLRVFAGDLVEVVSRFGDAPNDVLEMTNEALHLGDSSTRERTARDDALQSLRVRRAHQPDPMARNELDVVTPPTEHTRILVAAGNASAAMLLVH